MESLSSKSLSGFFWLGSSSGVKAVLQIVVTGVLARLLTPDDFGVIAAAIVIILFTEIIYEMGLGPAIVQKKDIDTGHFNTAFTITTLLGILLAILLYFLNPSIETFFEVEGLKEVLDLLVWLLPIKTISQISYSLIQRKMLFKKIAGMEVISYFFGYALVGIVLAFLDFGVWALVWANFIQSILYTILLLRATTHKFQFFISLEKLKSLVNFGMGFTLSQLLNFAARKLDYVIIAKTLGTSPLGFYSRAYGLMNAPNTILGKVMNQVLFSSMSKVQDSNEKIQYAIKRCYSVLISCLFPVIAYCILVAPELIYILLGDKWGLAIIPFQILVAGVFFRVGYKVGGSYLKSIGKVYVLSFTQFLYLSFIAIGSFIGSFWGIVGVSFGVTSALFLQFLIMTIYTIKYSKFNFFELLKDLFIVFINTSIISLIVFVLIKSIRENVHTIIILTIVSLIFAVYYFVLFKFRKGQYLGSGGQWLINQMIKRIKK